MTNSLQQPELLLQSLESSYRAEGVPTGWIEPTEADPYRTLAILFDELGDRQTPLRLELCFLPHMEAAEAEGVAFLQTFAAIAENIAPAHYTELLRITARLNTTLPLGAFGLFEDSGTLYYKHNTLLLLSNGEQACVRAIDAQGGLIIHLLQLYTDALLSVAGEASAEAGLASLGL
jgi:hypothetical protein